jgi:hypothetical protein
MLILRKLTLPKFFLQSLLLLATIATSTVYGQKKLPETVITVEVNDVPFSELLEIISKKSGIPFSYNPKKIEAIQKLNYKAINKTLTQILNELSEKYSLSYTLVENQIILKPEKKKESTAHATATVSGVIKNNQSGEALIGATILVKELQTGSVSNAFGFYSLTLPKKAYTITYSFVGFKDSTVSVDLNAPVKSDIALAEAPPLLKEVVINSAPDVATEIQPGSINIQPAAIEERPALFGEMDVVKSLESVPGIKMHSDGSTFYYVRGGNRDQNLMLIDDAPIYNPSHMLGVFSTIIPDAVNDITIYKGDMPASLGGRLSSVLDVRTKKGNDQHFQGWGNAGLLSTKIGIEGPIRKNASSFLLTARVSTVKWLAQLADKNIKQFNFYDVTGKTNVRFSPGNRLYLSFYTGGDNYFNNNNGISWTNTAGTLRWNHLFSDKLFANTTMAISGYDYFLYTDIANNTRWNSHISNINLKSDFSYFMRPENEITFGWGLNGYNFNPGNLLSNAPVPSQLSLSIRNSVEFIVYGNQEVKLNDRWGVNYGLRLTSWTNTGEAFEFIYDQNRNPVDTLYYKKGEDYKKYVNLEPRLTLSYLLNENSSFKTSFSRNIQNVHLISNSISPFTSLEVWLPSSINIKPQVSNQMTLGYYRSGNTSGTAFTAEAFYKKMFHQIDYNAHAQTFLNPLLEGELRFGTGTAYGLEFMAKKDIGRLRGLAGYTYSRAKRKFNDINQGKQYNAFYDRPHQVNLMAAYDLTSRWNFGMNWIYSTGAPYSSPISFYTYNGEEVPVYGQKNNDRLPDYHRLDISATVKLNKNPEKKFQHNLSFSIYNVYGRKNALFVNYNKAEVSDGSYKIPTNLQDASRGTSQFYLFRFTPSITYNFKWL